MALYENHEIFSKVKQASKINYNFIIKALKDLEKHNIEVKIFESNITDKESSGYFNYEAKVLALSKLDSVADFVGLFAHEFCHFIQWKRNLKVWKDSFNAIDYFDPYYYGKDVSKSIKLIQNLERDCESKVLKYIATGKLELDKSSYIKSANCYIAFHDIINLTRKWYKIPVNCEEGLYQFVPSDRLIRSIECLGPLKHEFILECIKNVY